jgi:hypothetical protein
MFNIGALAEINTYDATAKRVIPAGGRNQERGFASLSDPGESVHVERKIGSAGLSRGPESPLLSESHGQIFLGA